MVVVVVVVVGGGGGGDFRRGPMSMYTFILLIPEVFFCARNFRDFLFTSKHGRPMVLFTLNQEKPVNPSPGSVWEIV